jgi:RimJ/RimL family protein N-acetyltransferase
MKSAGIQSNRRAQMGSKRGDRHAGLPFRFLDGFAGAQAMTFATEVSTSDLTLVMAREVDAKLHAKTRRIPALKTARLVLRAPARDDVSTMVALAGDRRVAENTARIPHPYTTADAVGLITAIDQKGAEMVFAIELDGALIGMCGLDPRPDGAELGYWLGVPFWEHGYATEAARAVIDYAFAELGHKVLHSGARVSNPASRRVLEKCGFQWTGVQLCRIRAINSAAPIDRFRLDRGLWASLKAWGQTRQVA